MRARNRRYIRVSICADDEPEPEESQLSRHEGQAAISGQKSHLEELKKYRSARQSFS
jgi:hypothetical protein